MSVTGVEEEEEEGDGIGRVEVEATGGGTPVPMCFLPVCQQPVSGLWPQTLSEEGLMQGERAQDA